MSTCKDCKWHNTPATKDVCWTEKQVCSFPIVTSAWSDAYEEALDPEDSCYSEGHDTWVRGRSYSAREAAFDVFSKEGAESWSCFTPLVDEDDLDPGLYMEELELICSELFDGKFYEDVREIEIDDRIRDALSDKDALYEYDREWLDTTRDKVALRILKVIEILSAP